MARKSVRSFYISDEALEVVTTYKEENRLGSNGVALEKILLDEYSKKEKINEEYIKKIIDDILKHKDITMKRVENLEVSVEEVFDEVKASSIEAMKKMMKQISN